MNKAVNQYLKAIDRALRCDRRTKKAVLATLQSRIAETDAAEEAWSFERLCNRFGAPQALTESYLELTEPAASQNAAKHRRGILIAAGAVLLAALLLWGVMLLSLYLEGRKNVGGFTVDILGESEYLLAEDTTNA